ncbi:ABC transporter ATP-binding protein [Breznakiella homolactica]|uniref:ABC transporter ATP-binding protein n=1 Tax=Breznakiella homolactica TaxID=2798577 RepID=A0A7T8B8K9_9SPIR|nr:ABC transporter ATP-binding protein [Breznakiella homolactica]QQO08719.1 ABC transporter ATP-binding protein/permease [Breznakiella homolactica]
MPRNRKPRLQDALMLTDKGYRDLLKATLACTLTNFSLMLPFMVMIQMLVEVLKPLSGGEISWNRMWIYLGLGIIAALLVFLASKNDYKKCYVASYMESENTRISLAEHIRRLPMSVFNSKDLSELTTNMMGDVTTSEHVMSHIIPQLFANAISITLICIAMAFFDWRMALAVYATVPLAFLIVLASRKMQRRLGNKHAEAKLAAAGQVQEYIEGIKVIKACGLDGEKFTALEEALRAMKNLAIRFELGTGVFITGAQVVLQAGIGITVLAGTYLITGSAIGFIPLLMFLLIVTRIYGPVLTELTLLPELLYQQIAIGRMRRLMEEPTMEGDTDVALKDYTIQFDKVDFRYNKEGEAAIKEMSVTIPADSITALVGPSGSGKSTVSRLVARFWDVNAGTITIGGRDVKTIDPEELMGYMSFVFQDVVLFNDTIYNNIRIGNINATHDEIMAAAEAACCDEFVLNLPQGYDTLLGENGSTLSGGERQRLSIARALLKDAPIVLLDEATASLDPENEALIQRAISRLIAGKTVIVIAHRLRTITEADRIIVMNEGRVAEQGRHEELITRNGLYHRLFSIQQESLGWSV